MNPHQREREHDNEPHEPVSPPATGNPHGPGLFAPGSESVAESIDDAELLVPPADEPAGRGFWRAERAALVAVSLGGVLGANARFVAGTWVSGLLGDHFPWATLVINVSGSFVLGLVLTLAAERLRMPPAVRLFLGTGLLGAYTTFSAFSFEAVLLLRSGEVGLAVLYVAASLLLGLAAAVLGVRTARAV